MPHFTPRPYVIEAVVWDGTNLAEMARLLRGRFDGAGISVAGTRRFEVNFGQACRLLPVPTRPGHKAEWLDVWEGWAVARRPDYSLFVIPAERLAADWEQVDEESAV